jgi:hypothetical protein
MESRTMLKTARNLILGTLLTILPGCAGGWGACTRSDATNTLTELCARPQIERGERRPVIDGIGWVVGIPSKIILWDRRVDNHSVSPETEETIAQYVQEMGLSNTKVRINQYAPIDEWRRLTTNHEVAWGWRYTVGVLSWLDDAVFPGRIFGDDNYNPYTNTISIYSDSSAIAIKEGSRARDVRSRQYPGTYAVVNSLPIVSMWYDTVATRYAFEYMQSERPDVEPEGFRLLYPSYGAHLGSDLASFTYVPNLIGAAVGAIPGHIIGRYKVQRTAVSETEETARAQSNDEASRKPLRH